MFLISFVLFGKDLFQPLCLLFRNQHIPRRWIVAQEELLATAVTPEVPKQLSASDDVLATAWDRDAGLLLAERAQRRGDGVTQVVLPARLSVSSLVTL